MFAFLIYAILFFSCSKEPAIQEFSKELGFESATSATPGGGDDIRTFATATVTYHIFSSATISSNLRNDGQPIEVGMKFRVTQAGYITGVRFYKKAGNTGTHIGHLWSNTGTKLAEAIFTSETASGWQQVVFNTPVAVTTGKTYVASYFSSAGFYNVTRPYFTSAIINGPVRALANGEDGDNGVFKFSTASVFPNSSNQSSNFWVDVVFSASVATTPSPSATIPITRIKYLLLPKGTAQTYTNKSNLVIENLSFTNKNASFQSGHILVLNGCSNITIRNCYFGSSVGAGIYMFNCTNIKIENSLFVYNSTAILASRSKGGIYAKNCQYVNMHGKGTLGAGGGEFYKLVECTGPGFGVENCKGENFLGESNPEDIVSLFKSSGTAASPIIITGNFFKGGGPSNSGGGIVAGDGDASFTGGYVNITNNTLVNPGQYGIAAGGGTNITITGNKIYSAKFPWANNPLFVWNQYSPECANITVKNNRVNWTDKDGNINNGWNAGNCSNTVFEKPTSITLAEMNIPSNLVSFVTAAELLTVRASR
jgi:hypothetical protein